LTVLNKTTIKTNYIKTIKIIYKKTKQQRKANHIWHFN
ncbi:hypothetical protein EC253486_5617, partial [Escherichia coli 2534-86]